MKKRLGLILALLVLICFVTACKKKDSATGDITGDMLASIDGDTSISTDMIAFEENDTFDSSWEEKEYTEIRLENTSLSVTDSKVKVNGNTAEITTAGTYRVIGSLTDGQIVVNAKENDVVTLLLDGVTLSSGSTAPISVVSAEKVILSLADGTTNIITDAATRAEGDETTAAIYSKADFTINGTGKLAVNATYNNGIQGKDSLKVVGGEISVNAVNDGIVGKDDLQVKDATISIVSGGDGMKSTNSESEEKGFIAIDGGKISIVAGSDGIQASTDVIITGGEISVTTGGGSEKAAVKQDSMSGRRETQAVETNEGSYKAIKASKSILITGGTFLLDSLDDSIHSNHTVIINNGVIVASSGDDGIHADTAIVITDGKIQINKSYEGIESNSIAISGGEITVVSSDDGIIVSGGMDASSVNGRPGQNRFTDTEGENKLLISGGIISVNASGDGIDVNGSAYMSGGFVTVNGPTNSGNGALDYDRVFEITGGTLIAAGSSGMAQTPSESSSQNSVMLFLAGSQATEREASIRDAEGGILVTYSPKKAYQSLIISSELLKEGETYSFYRGDTKVMEFTISGRITKAYEEGAESGRGSFGGGGFGGNKGMRETPPDGEFTPPTDEMKKGNRVKREVESGYGSESNL
ncbi:MAG: carbohydrate-binding domain-containing protein [Clostridia bacterium]|nr:carbohydrate-binding domain-containing protein [Clostridia bacterium]